MEDREPFTLAKAKRCYSHLKEDKCLEGSSHIQQVLASLNNAVLGLFDFLAVKNVPRQMQIFLAKPNLALALLIEAIY